jgi:hypothetical protein
MKVNKMNARTLIEAEVRNKMSKSKNALPSLPSIVGNHFEGFMSNLACRMIRINDYTDVKVVVRPDQATRITIPVFVQKWNRATDNGFLAEQKAIIVFRMRGIGKGSLDDSISAFIRWDDGSEATDL